MSPDCISWGLFFQIFLGGMPPDPPRKSMLRMLSVLRTLASYSVQVQVCLTNPELLPPPLYSIPMNTYNTYSLVAKKPDSTINITISLNYNFIFTRVVPLQTFQLLFEHRILGVISHVLHYWLCNIQMEVEKSVHSTPITYLCEPCLLIACNVHVLCKYICESIHMEVHPWKYTRGWNKTHMHSHVKIFYSSSLEHYIN